MGDFLKKNIYNNDICMHIYTYNIYTHIQYVHMGKKITVWIMDIVLSKINF